jgi:hypothetical protein
MMLANAVAMRLAGIDRHTPDVPGGTIVRDKDGNPTGIFKDAAKDLVERVIPPPSDAQVDAALPAAQHYALLNGLTSVQDMGFTGSHAADLQARVVRGYQQLMAEGKWKVRVSARFPLRTYLINRLQPACSPPRNFRFARQPPRTPKSGNFRPALFAERLAI